MTYAYVTTNLLDLWSRPRFNSERLNQLLFGELVVTGSERQGYVRVTQTDGYVGWADRRFLAPVSQRRATAWNRNVNSVVSSQNAKLHREPSGPTAPPHFLYYGTRIVCRRKRGGSAFCELPDGTRFQLKQNCLRPISSIRNKKITGVVVGREAKRFLGVPYLWGGVTPAGFDCSGLMRAVFGAFGIYLPRDTKDQVKIGAAVDRQDIRSGDLIFFNRHVGLALGRNQLVHASVGGSGVRVNSLRPGDEGYRVDLDESYAATRRIL